MNRGICRVLVIDDDQGFAESLHGVLELMGFQCHYLCNTQNLLQHVADYTPHVVLIDVRLENDDGVEVLRKLHDQFPWINYIMITAYAGTDEAIRALRYQAYDYLRKPIEADDLLAAVSRAFQKSLLEQQKRNVEMELEKERNFVSQILETTVALVVLLDQRGHIVRFNRASEIVTGYQAWEVMGKEFWPLLVSGNELVEARQVFTAALENSDNIALENHIRRKDATLRYIAWSSIRMSIRNEEEDYVLLSGQDITEAHQLSTKLSYQASYDSLTGLVNRAEFEKRLERTLVSCKENGTEHALCYLDLDQFKVINDTCGHVAGDEMLRQLGDRLKKKLRKRDTLARLGGDEFAILFENCKITHAAKVAEQIRESIHSYRFPWEDKSFSIGVSLGLVPIDRHSEGQVELLRAADNACYTAKDQGRNRIHIYSPDDTELVKRQGELQWITQVNEALENDRFLLYHQLIQKLGQSYENVGAHYEILLRLQDETGKLIPPGAFLPAVERFGLAQRLDNWVVNRVFDWFEQHQDELDNLAMCSINLSGHSLVDGDFLQMMLELLHTRRLQPEKLCLEVTETAAIANLSHATKFINELKTLGCRFALDDFGSGLSSFAYLKNLPVDFLKIDGMFIKDMLDDPIDFAMVDSINEIGHVMGKKTIAEFVESEELLNKLQDIGVDYAQGYAIARPAPLIQQQTLRSVV